MEYLQEDIDKFDEQRKGYIIADPTNELLEIYIQSTIIETLGLRAGKITEKQDTTYSKFIDLMQNFLKSKSSDDFKSLKLEVENKIGKIIKLPGKFMNYKPDIRQLESIEFQLQYLHDLIK